MAATTDHQLTRAIRAYRAAEASLEHARASLHAAILEQLRAHTPQAELARQTGYSREQLRRIARHAGLPADGRGRPADAAAKA